MSHMSSWQIICWAAIQSCCAIGLHCTPHMFYNEALLMHSHYFETKQTFPKFTLQCHPYCVYFNDTLSLESVYTRDFPFLANRGWSDWVNMAAKCRNFGRSQSVLKVAYCTVHSLLFSTAHASRSILNLRLKWCVFIDLCSCPLLQRVFFSVRWAGVESLFKV